MKPKSLTNALKTPLGSIAFSVILGLGLAALFRKACHDNKCIIVSGPDPEELKQYYYKMSDGDCYKYDRVFGECKH